MSDARLTEAQVEEAGLVDWRVIGRNLLTRLRTGNFATGLRLVNLIGEAAEAANHHPDLDLRYPHLNIRLTSHDAGGLTNRDIDLAQKISHLAAEAGVSAEPWAVEVIELALDTPDYERIKPFWRAIMGYRDNPDLADEVRNDDADYPPIWFQRSGSDEPRQRFHIDVRVPKEMSKPRIDATVAAGGKIVDEQATFVVLEDADGNRACVCF